MLSIKDLNVSFATRRGEVDAVRGISLDVAKGKILGIVGESGSGKSVTSYALMRILDSGGYIKQGEIRYSGIDIRNATEREMSEIRGREISMIFQNPRAALNPIRKIGPQIEDVLRQHAQATRYTAKAKAIEALKAVKIRNAEERYDAYPFELSGGMCQRVVIAIALACNPRLLIADEPTTGLDIITQKAVMGLVLELIHERQMSAILITHDLGLAAEYCDQIVVMQNGEIVERGTPQKIFSTPDHPYTQRLVKATPSKSSSIRDLLSENDSSPLLPRQISKTPLLEIEDLTKTYQGKSGPVHAVKGVSFKIFEGQTVGLVGESGCGKSTISSMLVRLLDSSSGKIIFNGKDLTDVPCKAFAKDPRRTDIQMVFQDATDCLNPRFTARQSIADPLKRLLNFADSDLKQRIEELALLVGLPVHLLDRFPHQLSGGQKARVGIARAISVNPKFLILDEPTAALDVSIQAIVLNLLADLREKLNMSFLFVSHDLQVVKLLSDHVIVMRDGQIVEQGPTDSVINHPTSAYTRTLLSTAPKPQTGLTAA